jgi:hypothetical protein
MLWARIATGKRCFKHGIPGFTQPALDGAAVQPVSLDVRGVEEQQTPDRVSQPMTPSKRH